MMKKIEKNDKITKKPLESEKNNGSNTSKKHYKHGNKQPQRMWPSDQEKHKGPKI